MTKIQEHYYRVRSKLLSCKKEEFPDRAARVDGHLLAAFQELGDVEDVPQSTVANRYRDDPKRCQRPKNPPLRRAATPPLKRQAAAGGGGSASGTSDIPSMYVRFDISSDSEAVEALRNGGAPSDDDEF